MPFPLGRCGCTVAAVMMLHGCSTDPTGISGGIPAAIEVVSGDAQSAPAASVVPNPIRVRIVDTRGEPVAGVGVAFIASAGSGILSPATAESDADGIVSGSWQLPGHTGTMHGRAEVDGLDPVSFTAISIPGAANAVVLLGSDEIITDAGVAVDTAMRVRVVDQYGNPIGGMNVTFRTSSGGGAPGAASAVSDAEGLARVTWRIPGNTGWHTLTAEAGSARVATMHGLVFAPQDDAQISVGGLTGCVITDRLYCWGQNTVGQVGDGSTINRAGPTPVLATASWRSIAVGRGQQTSGAACAVTTSDALYCWGGGLPGGEATPAIVSGAPPVRAVAVGSIAACLLSVDKRVLCWGSNVSGQLGNGTTTVASTPTQIQSGERFRSVSMGTSTACAISLAGRLFCWGSNSAGILGEGSSTGRPLPAPIVPTKRWSRVIVQGGHACAEELGSNWYCWGGDDFSRVSGEPVSLGRVLEPRLLAHVAPTDVMVLGSSASCGLSANGQATCWGDNRFAALGDLERTQQLIPSALQPPYRFAELSLSQRTGCGITTSAEVVCWGQNLDGAVGVPDETFAGQPVRVIGAPPFVQITAGGQISCGLTNSGEAWCWGLGSPVEPVPGGHQFTSIDAGDAGVCGLDASGIAWCWGNPALLGLGGDPTSVPRAVAGGPAFTAIAVGGVWACGLDDTARPWCWGSGRGTPSHDQSIPFAVGSSEPVSVMRPTGPYGGMCGVTMAQAVSCWFPGSGILGIRAQLLEPYFGPGVTDVITGCVVLSNGSTKCQNGENLPAGTFTAALDGPCGVGQDGVARCYGYNQHGSLGIGIPDELYPTPLPILGPVAMLSVSIGGAHGCGLDATGQAWCWGTDDELALGNGARLTFPTPQSIFALQGGAQ